VYIFEQMMRLCCLNALQSDTSLGWWLLLMGSLEVGEYMFGVLTLMCWWLVLRCREWDVLNECGGLVALCLDRSSIVLL
jgi:hypothetical protein